ncbi:MAG TPA: septal ring lytic transglycosylase RlpA family lipoprotein [Sulfurovum sp. UBA12169]|nr:MAG TPA: septal ring lytic transglycosylase RlpA family lipoprotein [Sulfurovum sp. UBA12169]
MKKLNIILSLFVFLVAVFLNTGCSQKSSMHKPKATKFTSAARHKWTMKEYCVLGKNYKPTYVSVGQTMNGISSWYGPDFHGKMTSNGEVYNMHGQTAAHKTWPMDTMVKIKNLQNGKSTIARINDRGPFVQGRIIDCSYAAGKAIGLDRMGIAKVQIKVVGFAGEVQSDATIARNIREHTEARVVITDFGIQVGAFRRFEGAQIYKKKYAQLDKRYQPIVKRFDDVEGAPLYRVWLMGFKTEDEAKDFILCHGLEGAFIVRN